MPTLGRRTSPSFVPSAASRRAHSMPRTNVVGTTAPSGSGAQRCAQAGEREHRTDSTARPATATATGATAHKAKHYCRNPRCRSRLPEPVENEHRAFCTRDCHENFYRNQREFLRREQIRRLSDSRLAQLRRELPEVQRDLDAEARRRRSKSAENFHEGQTFHKGRIRFWHPCPICHDRACRSQSCRDAERRIAQGRW